MSEHLSPEERSKWHRWFAIDCNNLSWDLASRPRTEEEDTEMLNAAHAAAFHWSKTGTELNDIRARMLLALVHALLGNGRLAMAYAVEAHTYLIAHAAPDWEQALAHTVLAHAAAANAEADIHAKAWGDARCAIDAIADPEDKTVVQTTFHQVPLPAVP